MTNSDVLFSSVTTKNLTTPWINFLTVSGKDSLIQMRINPWRIKSRYKKKSFKAFIALTCLESGFPSGRAGKKSACNAGDLGSVPGLGRSPGEGKGYPLQYCGLENSMDCTVHGAAELDTTQQLSLSLPAVSEQLDNYSLSFFYAVVYVVSPFPL